MKARLLQPRGALIGGLCAVLLLSVSTTALATHNDTVVPPTGKAAGHGYGFWMQRHWQLVFGLGTGSSSSPCKILTAGGKQVAFLSGPFNTGTHSCTEPSRRPIYINLVSVVCNTFPGQHPGFGTSDAQLRACSKSFYRRGGSTASATVDGHAINVKALVAATPAFPVHAVASNPVGVPAGNGRAAAYGIGLLFTGFPTGSHTIHTIATGGGGEQNITWIVNVP